MRSQFIEKRRQLREPVDTGFAQIDGSALPLVNWSQNGLLLRTADAPAQPGGRISAQVELVSAGQRFIFPAELRVVRWQPERRLLAASYVCLDVPEAQRIAKHFQPAPAGRPRFIADKIEPAPPPKPESPVREPASMVVPEDVRLADMVIAQKEIAALKTAFARQFHPDRAARDAAYALRVEIFKEFWGVLEAAEERVKGRK